MVDAYLADVSVLLAEDEAFTRRVMRKYLEKFGCQPVLEATDGDAALALAVQHRPHIILCDIAMEPTGGLAFVQRLRDEDPGLATTPVILVTAHGDDAFTNQAAELDVRNYLIKPVQPDTLREVMSREVRARSAM